MTNIIQVEEVRKPINFTEYIPKAVRGPYKTKARRITASVDIKKGTISFTRPTIKYLEMSNKFVSFHFDAAKKIIGFRIDNNVPPGEVVSRYTKYRFVKPYRNGKGSISHWSAGIRGITEKLTGLTKERYLLPIKKHVDSHLGQIWETTYFIDLKEGEKKEVSDVNPLKRLVVVSE